jgi:transcription elongation GreA/GreB family factor
MEPAMASHYEFLVSAGDARPLANVVGGRESHRLESGVPNDELPPDRIAMNTRVLYEEKPRGKRRMVTLVHPSKADASDGRISTLSPIGRALLGRRAGSVAAADLPDGQALKIRILRVERL